MISKADFPGNKQGRRRGDREIGMSPFSDCLNVGIFEDHQWWPLQDCRQLATTPHLS
jgi:hypothetical protein